MSLNGKIAAMNRSVRILPFLLAILCSSVATMYARPQVDARLDTTSIRIGDPVTVTLSVRTSRGESVVFPDFQKAPEKFETLSAGSPERYDEGNGASLERRSYRLTTFETGRVEIPPLPFVVMNSGGDVDTVYTDPLPLEVVSLLQDTTSTDVRPLKPIIEVPPLWHRLALFALAGIAVLGVLIWLWRRYLSRRDRRLTGVKAESAPRRPAHLAALEELDRIKALGLIEKGEVKQFHILISDAIRRYIFDLYGIEAPDMTTWELCEALRPERILGEEKTGEFQEFLEACDLVKFAKYKPPVVEINSVFNKAYDLIELARPRPEDARMEPTAAGSATVGPETSSGAVR
jgi:hypothetical protein